MTKNKKMRMILLMVAVLAVGLANSSCDNSGDVLDNAEDFLNNSDMSKAVNGAVDSAGDALEDAASDVMNAEVPEIDLPEVNAKANGESVLDALETVGDAVKDVGGAAVETTEDSCQSVCEFAFEGDNLVACLAQCTSQ